MSKFALILTFIDIDSNKNPICIYARLYNLVVSIELCIATHDKFVMWQQFLNVFLKSLDATWFAKEISDYSLFIKKKYNHNELKGLLIDSLAKDLFPLGLSLYVNHNIKQFMSLLLHSITSHWIILITPHITQSWKLTREEKNHNL